MSTRDELLDLVDGYLAGSLDAQAHADLERRLCGEPQSCRLFWAALNHELLLRRQPWAETDADRGAGVPTASELRVSTRPWWRRPRVMSAMAACAALLLAVLGWQMLASTGDSAVIAQVANVDAPTGDAGLLHHADQRTQPLVSGLSIRAGDRIAVALGAAVEVRLAAENTRLDLGSRAILRLGQSVDGLQLDLSSGTLNATVALQPPGRTLSVTTPHATVNVIGTRFSVHADETRTSVEVDHGRVRVTSVEAGSIDLGAGDSTVAEPGKPLTPGRIAGLSWSDRRPLGVLMLCRNTSGWATNPRGWFGDAKVDTTTPAGLVAFNRRLDALIDSTIANLRDIDAQGVVFWDIEGLEHPPGYVGDPRLLATLAPEMDAAADRIMERLRSAGFAVGVTVRSETIERLAGGGLMMRRLSDPTPQVHAKIAYAQRRWGATLFPLLGNGGDALTMSTLCRRISAATPGILLIPTGSDAETWRWGAPWRNPSQPSGGSLAAAHEARQRIPGAFAVIALQDAPWLSTHRDELLQAVRAGDVLTFRAWNRGADHAIIKSLMREAATP